MCPRDGADDLLRQGGATHLSARSLVCFRLKPPEGFVPLGVRAAEAFGDCAGDSLPWLLCFLVDSISAGNRIGSVAVSGWCSKTKARALVAEGGGGFRREPEVTELCGSNSM